MVKSVHSNQARVIHLQNIANFIISSFNSSAILGFYHNLDGQTLTPGLLYSETGEYEKTGFPLASLLYNSYKKKQFPKPYVFYGTSGIVDSSVMNLFISAHSITLNMWLVKKYIFS